jgi:hypothetical protein
MFATDDSHNDIHFDANITEDIREYLIQHQKTI